MATSLKEDKPTLCSDYAMTVVSGNIRFMRIFAEVT